MTSAKGPSNSHLPFPASPGALGGPVAVAVAVVVLVLVAPETEVMVAASNMVVVVVWWSVKVSWPAAMVADEKDGGSEIPSVKAPPDPNRLLLGRPWWEMDEN